jgi:hypothetical protein
MTQSIKFFGHNDIVLSIVQGQDIRIAISPDDSTGGQPCYRDEPEPTMPGLEWLDYMGDDPMSAMSCFGDKAIDDML